MLDNGVALEHVDLVTSSEPKPAARESYCIHSLTLSHNQSSMWKASTWLEKSTSELCRDASAAIGIMVDIVGCPPDTVRLSNPQPLNHRAPDRRTVGCETQPLISRGQGAL